MHIVFLLASRDEEVFGFVFVFLGIVFPPFVVGYGFSYTPW